jgi:hypothetical protein
MLLKHIHKFLMLLSLLCLELLVLMQHLRPHVGVSITEHFWLLITVVPSWGPSRSSSRSRHFALTANIKSS